MIESTKDGKITEAGMGVERFGVSAILCLAT